MDFCANEIYSIYKINYNKYWYNIQCFKKTVFCIYKSIILISTKIRVLNYNLTYKQKENSKNVKPTLNNDNEMDYRKVKPNRNVDNTQ